MARVAVVTGSNRGIGLAIVRALCKQFDGITYLTARNSEEGLKAVEQLKEEGLSAKFHQLDITDKESIAKLKDYLLSTYGGLDILVNNAGIYYKPLSVATVSEKAEVTMRTNFWGLLAVCEQLFPILRSHARVVHVASLFGQYALNDSDPEMKSRLLNCKSVDEVGYLMEKFVQDAKEGAHQERGWAYSDNTEYSISKVGVILVTKLQQADIDKDTTRQDIVINACCPGYVATSMTDFKGILTTDEGAITPTYCALLPSGISEPRGEFLFEKNVVPVASPMEIPTLYATCYSKK